MFDRLRKSFGRFVSSTRTDVGTGEDKRRHNLFEAAAVYVSACAEDDQDRIDEASAWVSPEALSFGVSELACRAVIALARERDESPQRVARDLLGLPAA
ncbi:hypothetical protein [Streptomyces sp. NPDC046862]|uniref:hypothetical protein n=1 Tax=Streptomyces sp. NPDC046862 TaxID=3154603 RepID=UPI0034533DE0